MKMFARVLTVAFFAVITWAGVKIVRHYSNPPAMRTAAELYIAEEEHLRTVHPDGSHCSARYWTDGVHEARQ